MEPFTITNTTEQDIPFICWMFDEAILYQQKNKFPVWNGYDVDVIKNDIKEKIQYKIIIHNEIACIFSTCSNDPIIWEEKDKDSAIYLHRIVVNPKHKGKQQFAKIFEWAKKYCLQKNIDYLRMDTWADNPTIIKYYCSFGFNFLNNFTTPNTNNLPVQHRNIKLALLEFPIAQ